MATKREKQAADQLLGIRRANRAHRRALTVADFKYPPGYHPNVVKHRFKKGHTTRGGRKPGPVKNFQRIVTRLLKQTNKDGVRVADMVGQVFVNKLLAGDEAFIREFLKRMWPEEKRFAGVVHMTKGREELRSKLLELVKTLAEGDRD